MLLQQDTDYIEHEEQIITFPLEQNQKLMLGDYLAADGIHHVRKRIILNGTENWQITTTNDLKRFYLSASNTVSDNETINCICSHYHGISRSDMNTSNGDVISVTGSFINILSKNISALEEFKAYLAEQYTNNTPVVVEYNLENEEIEEYTEEQQAVYNKLQKLLLYKHYNYIECIDEVNCKMKLTYRPDKYLSLEERVKALETVTSEVNI